MRNELSEHAGRHNLAKADALSVFDASPKELRDETGVGGRQVQAPFIFHRGVWKRLTRTDDRDDVCTYYEETGKRDVFAFYRSRIVLGARFDERTFACIDAFTDG